MERVLLCHKVALNQCHVLLQKYSSTLKLSEIGFYNKPMARGPKLLLMFYQEDNKASEDVVTSTKPKYFSVPIGHTQVLQL